MGSLAAATTLGLTLLGLVLGVYAIKLARGLQREARGARRQARRLRRRQEKGFTRALASLGMLNLAVERILRAQRRAAVASEAQLHMRDDRKGDEEEA